MIPTNRGPMQPERIICELTYINYKHNRGLGMTAEDLGRFLPKTGVVMEQRYQRELEKGGAEGLSNGH